jgi:hypothetical protein
VLDRKVLRIIRTGSERIFSLSLVSRTGDAPFVRKSANSRFVAGYQSYGIPNKDEEGFVPAAIKDPGKNNFHKFMNVMASGRGARIP